MNTSSTPAASTLCLAEVLGTFVLIFFGCGAVHVAILMEDLTGLWQGGVVWGIAIMLAIYVVGPISGAHINPAITIGLAAWGRFSWKLVPLYVVSQLAGAFLAAALLFALFHGYLTAKEAVKGVVRGEPGSVITAMCYGEYYPSPGPLAVGAEPYNAQAHAKLNNLVNLPVACLAEVLGTAILALVVVSVTEPRNASGPGNLAAVFIGVTVTALICVLAPLTQACFNPARDFGPRLFAYLAGWRSAAIPGPNGWSFMMVYVIAPLVGGVLGVGLFDRFLRRHVLAAKGAED